MLHRNLASGYNHFIYGKFASDSDSGYRIVARSTDLTDEESLKTLAETHRFWGTRSPEGNGKAIGIFSAEGNNNLVLVKVETAVDDNGQEVSSGDRGFKQRHYIFIPKDLVAKQLRGRKFKLLNWMKDQRIPLFPEFEANLQSLAILPLNDPLPTELNQEEVDKIKFWLNDTNSKGQSSLLLALAALNNGKRLLLTGDKSTDFFESILLLLPASVRNEVSVAGGILDEQHCGWANVLIKLNNSSQYQPVEDIIWLNCGTREFAEEFDKNTTSKYVRLLQSILKTGDIDHVIPPLLKQLDSIEDNNVTLKEPANLNIIVRLIEEFPQIFQQVWQSILSAKQILGELEKNLHLAETLLKEKLLDQPYCDKDTVIVQQIVALCKKVVEYKSEQDSQTALQLAIYFATKKIFQDNIVETFALLDTAITDKIDLLNFFNDKFAPLVVHFEAAKIIDSNLYKQLKIKKPEVAQLLNVLLTQKKAVLKDLPKLANLTGMKEPEQDKFYETVLVTWSPSYDDARELLAALIEQSQGIGSKNFNRNALVKTCAWFEGKKPELSDIFITLWQPKPTISSDWDIWKQLAKALYENQQDSAAFLDKIFGTRFPIEVLETWLPVIAEDNDVRRKFCRTSLAWQQLRSQHKDFERLVATEPKYAITWARCLRDSDRLDWLNGKLLHYLCDYWIKKRYVDDDLRALVTDPDVAQTFTTHDWLKLQHLCWTIGTGFNLPLGKPNLEVGEKHDLVNIAIQIANDPDRQPAQTRRLLQDCKAWQLELTQLKDILKSVADQARDFDLVLDYISSDLTAIDPTQDIPPLFEQMSQLSSAFLSQLLNERLKQNLPLAEILLNHGLYEQKCLLENTDVKSELRTFCQRVVENKSKQNWPQAWELVKRLDRSTAFKDDSDRLDLLDAVRPTLTNQEKKYLWEYAITIVELYTQPEQMDRLLEDCSTWGLSLTEQIKILKANRQACDKELLFKYLDKGIDPEQN
ncbi:hypothetical protein [Nostoc sp. DedSLP04]|uniref:hypothetical protein n=1 Tax=Nostoc sp. DedSLP04 TaxID=3075401 RepID=UPI002AD37572|nr:hypothetical protein [Nostoc sp. DedSLP04]MDZ8034952.1 hypothetical protein [Nostoc sp. DedSLP04]